MTRIGNMRNAYLNDLVVDGVVRNKINKDEIGCACDAWTQLTLDRVLTDSREAVIQRWPDVSAPPSAVMRGNLSPSTIVRN